MTAQMVSTSFRLEISMNKGIIVIWAGMNIPIRQQAKISFFAFELQLGEAATARNAAGTRPAAFDVLTPREFEIVELMAQRLSNREIAEQLYLSEGSVKQYVNQIYSKLHIEGDTRTKRAQLARLLREKT